MFGTSEFLFLKGSSVRFKDKKEKKRWCMFIECKLHQNYFQWIWMDGNESVAFLVASLTKRGKVKHWVLTDNFFHFQLYILIAYFHLLVTFVYPPLPFFYSIKQAGIQVNQRKKKSISINWIILIISYELLNIKE